MRQRDRDKMRQRDRDEMREMRKRKRGREKK
jgi:hypothetical protein